MLKQWMERLEPPQAAAIVLLLFILLLTFESVEHVSHKLELLGTLAAIVAAVFTGALAWFAFVQVRESRASAERQLRAYIGVTKSHLVVEKDPSANSSSGPFEALELRGTLTVRNSGQTPAYGLNGIGAIRGGAEFDTAWIAELKQMKQSAYIIPEGVFEFRTVRKLSELSAEIPDGFEGEWKWFWFGRLDYIDAFGTERWVNFRLLLRGDIFRVLGGKPSTHPCEHGNEAN
jgi:hypothetical protein